MSVSVALIPVVLAMRVVMGEEGFENWVRSQEVRIPTNFEHETDLIITVRKAGYDAEKWGGLIKTHIQGERNFFFWELIDGVWTAIFSKTDSQEMVSRFIQELESKSGRNLFTTDADLRGSFDTLTRTFPTNFRDEQLLIRTLREYGLQPSVKPTGDIVCETEQSTLIFQPVEEGPYSVEVGDVLNLQQTFGLLSNLDEDYKRGVQAMAYEGLMRRIGEKKMIVESEEVLEDNSIVITLSVQERR